MNTDLRRKHNINRLLAQNGLGKLDDPGLIPQLGFLMGKVIEDHDQLREFLNKCEPRERVHMLEAVKPYLRFEPKPLDVYVAELGMLAEAKQLPTVAADGSLQPYKTPEIQTADFDWAALQRVREETRAEENLKTASKLIAEAVAKQRLTLTCIRCTREETHSGYDKRAAVAKAREAGWIHDPQAQTELCPLCAAA